MYRVKGYLNFLICFGAQGTPLTLIFLMLLPCQAMPA